MLEAAVVLLTGLTLWTAWKRGPNAAVGFAAATSLLGPAWISREIFGQPIDLVLAVVGGSLVMYCLHKKSVIRARPIPLDYAMMVLVLVHLLSDWTNTGFSFGVIARAYGEWALMYLAGRVTVQSLEDARDIMPFIVVVGSVLALLSVFEAVAGINLFEMVVGPRPTVVGGTPRDAMRWGLKRAFGPTRHPIYLGVLLLLLLPWLMYAASRTRRKAGPGWWVVTPAIGVAGILACGSRAPIIGVAVLFYVVAVLRLPQWRKPLIGLGGVAAMLIVMMPSLFLEGLHQWSGEKRGATVKVDGDDREYSATLNRVRVLEVYAPAIKKAGLLGFGTEATTGFPINVPVGPQHVATLKKTRFIDNGFVLMLLRFGWAGLAAFLAVSGLLIANQAKMSMTSRAQGQFFSAALAGATAALMLVLLTVWLPKEFCQLFLWTAGLTAGRFSRFEQKFRPSILKAQRDDPPMRAAA